MPSTIKTTRVYPACCTAAYCGRLECNGCPNSSILADFKAWRERTAAICEDPVWCPSVWTATR
jgi:hypothetical protein